ncbi:hypothetical protein [Mesorhizobium sp.]|uniref:SDH family Clp fold serine proteinase n=1 Tax=Mesorhizobium sp. TaxID=1871066 RepID=UPI000FE86B6F|nr:hypothetical protein [Mesorhizobium sp.]RWG08276.1 MAG: serine protease [Mesorhizobium sp.]RWG93263.1 MAG: serine protease [Mesorhizobium sp.]TIR88970.1 MAG: serine protease [Mesorhizobium sp.]TIS04432.1 MAG: serine protease [Mesorhizobium sp.]
MNYAARQAYYREIEKTRDTKVIAFVTGERLGLQTIIAGDAIEPFVTLLDSIGPTKKLSLILDTNGGHTSAAWRLIHLLRSFGDELEIIVPAKAMSAGTLMALGADRIVMTKQAALGPIDPSLENHALNPAISSGERVSVSAEAIRGYLAEIKKDVTDPVALASIWTHLATQIHPLVLGQIFRLGGQIRSMAKSLIKGQVQDEKKQNEIIELLCSDSGSHDYTINRRVAAEMGLSIEKPSDDLYKTLSNITKSYHSELKTLEPFSLHGLLAGAAHRPYTLVRGLIEATEAGCYGYVTQGEVTAPAAAGAPVGSTKTFEGWRKLP